jgi:hypothetical protein
VRGSKKKIQTGSFSPLLCFWSRSATGRTPFQVRTSAAGSAASPRACSPVAGSELDAGCACQSMGSAMPCRTTPRPSSCLRGDAAALAAAESFMSGQRSSAHLGSASPVLPCNDSDACWSGHVPLGQAQSAATPGDAVAAAPLTGLCRSPVPADGAARTPHAHADVGLPSDGHAAATIGSPGPLGAAPADDDVSLSALLRQFRLRL